MDGTGQDGYMPIDEYFGLPKHAYKIIYADPPWKYGGGKNPKTLHGLAQVHYPVMRTREICAMPVQELAHQDGAVLFLWVTPPMLAEGIKVMQAWGFEYKTVGFSWIKRNESGTPFFGLGFWTRSNAELCLIGTCGKDYPRRANNSISQIVETYGHLGHSKKPDIVRERIVSLMGDLPRVELFARGGGYDGWTLWGNEAEEYPAEEQLQMRFTESDTEYDQGEQIEIA